MTPKEMSSQGKLPEQTMIGQVVYQYRILEELGQGGMGVVYKAHDTKLDRIVALKFLPQHLRSSDQEKARFTQEARAAAVLNHPNVCSVIDIQESDGQQFIVMEFVDGEHVKSHIQKGQFSYDRIADIATQICEGLKSAHEKGIIHRDIKSENIMITNEGRVKIMDFGLAKFKGSPGLTKSGSTVGTIAYMSPEQIQSLELDQRSDLWSCGVVMYEMITGHLPFQAEHEAAVMYEILNVEPRPLQTIRPETPERLRDLVMQLLQKDASMRPASAAEIISRLKQPLPLVEDAQAKKSIAVLYLENMSSEKESDYFCAGITEDIITDLSKIKELNVVSRGDVLPFRNREVNTRQVGESLRVNYILEGSVRKAGQKIRITGQLIDVRTGFHVWAERYDRLVEDIFDLQDEIARSIVKALRISLTDSEEKSLGKKPTDDLRAYDFYMRGREHLYLRGKKNTEAAIQMFDRAISIDPSFAAAYAGIAEACSYMYNFYDGESRWLSKTLEASQKAVELDPQSVDGLFVIGIVYFHQKRLGEAKRSLEKVIQLKPDHYDAYRWLGVIADITGGYDAALGFYDRCTELKPYSEEPWMHLDMAHRRKGNREASNQAQRKVLEVGARKLQVNPDDVIVLSRMAGPYAHFGDREKAHDTLRKVLSLAPGDGLALYNCACTYAVLGDEKEALACLRDAINSGYKNVGEWVKADPDFAPYHNNPELKALIAEIG